MGHLDEPTFERTIASCARCGGTAFEIATYIDRYFDVMLGERNDDRRWVYDGEKLIDGVHRVTCAASACGAVAFESADCPRCHRADALADAVAATSRLAAPRRCPRCNDTELGVVGFAPAVVRTGAGKPAPAPTALLGEPGFHVIALGCNSCDWAQAAEGCPLCGAAAPLRARP